MKGVFICAAELEALHGCPPLAGMAYLWLRSFVDLRSGIVGRTRPVSLSMLRAYTETHTPRGSGVQITQPSERGIRTALAALERAGLLRRLGDDRSLLFRLPRMETLTLASGKPDANLTGELGAEPGAVDNRAIALPGAGFVRRREPNPAENPQGVYRPNPTHIRGQSLKPSPPHTASTHEPGLRTHEAAAAAVGDAELQAVSTLLRGAGVRVVGNEPELAALAGAPEADVLAAVELARQCRQAAGSTQPIGVRYLAALLERVRPRAGAVPTQAWWASESAMLGKGAELGLSPRPGEDWGGFKGRIRGALGRVA